MDENVASVHSVRSVRSYSVRSMNDDYHTRSHSPRVTLLIALFPQMMSCEVTATAAVCVSSECGLSPALLTFLAAASADSCWSQARACLRSRTQPCVVHAQQNQRRVPGFYRCSVGIPQAIPQAITSVKYSPQAALIVATLFAHAPPQDTIRIPYRWSGCSTQKILGRKKGWSCRTAIQSKQKANQIKPKQTKATQSNPKQKNKAKAK